MSKDKEYEVIIEERSTFIVRCGGDRKTDALDHALHLISEYKNGNLDEQTAPIQGRMTYKQKVVRIK